MTYSSMGGTMAPSHSSMGGTHLSTIPYALLRLSIHLWISILIKEKRGVKGRVAKRIVSWFNSYETIEGLRTNQKEPFQKRFFFTPFLGRY